MPAATTSKSAASKTVKSAAAKPAAEKRPAPAATKAKSAAKTAEKTAEKAATKPEKKTAKPAQKAEPAAKEKVRKPKLVRDSFTMPEAEYAVLGEVKKACLKAGIEVKKSELLRVGVALIRQLDTGKLQEILAGLPALKAGRPKKNK